MNRAIRQFFVFGVICGVLPCTAMAVPGIISAEVVEINGSTAGLPSTNVNVSTGDSVKIEMYLEGWTPEAIGFYQYRMSLEGGGSPLAVERKSCTVNADCPISGVCSGGLCACVENIFADRLRSDYIFFDRVVIDSGSCLANDIQFGGILFGPGELDTGGRFYLGNAVLTVPEGACGEYGMDFFLGEDETNIRTASSVLIDLTVGATLTINGPECSTCLNQIVDSDPANCDVDARQPHPVDDAGTNQGITELQVQIPAGCDPDSIVVGDFQVVEFPPFIPPAVVSVTSLGDDLLSIALNRPITKNKWTCVRLTANAGEQACVGYLPSDVNADLIANGDDIVAMTDILDGAPAPDYASDTNRNGETQPEDLLRLIDLLNGGGEYDATFGTTLIPCPN